MSAINIVRRILARLPEVYSKEEPVTTEEFNAPNGSFETAGATEDKAAEWTRTTNAVDPFEQDTDTQGRLTIALADPPEDDPLFPILLGSHAYVLGEFTDPKPARTAVTGNYVQIQSTYRFEVGGQSDLTHVAFRYVYISETDWKNAGEWMGELLIDSTVVWSVDIFDGATRYASYQEVQFPSGLSRGYHTITFRLRYAGSGYTGPLPTFLLDDVRMLRRTTTLATILYVILLAIAQSQQRAHDTRHAISDLISIARASGIDLENRGGEFGVPNPVTLGLSDEQYRNLIRLLVMEPKTTLKALRDVIKVITGAVPTFIQTGPVGNVPPILTIVLGSSSLTPAQAALVQDFFYG